MQVPETHTFSSRHKEGKDLADANAKIRAENEILQRETRDLLALKEEVIRKSGYTPAEYAKIEEEHLSNVKKAEDRTVALRNELGGLETRVNDTKDALAVYEARERELERKIAVLKSDIEILEKRKADALAGASVASEKYGSLIVEKSKKLSLLTEEVNAKENAHLVVTQDIEKRLKNVVEQERLSSIRRRDLEIYEARLRQKYPNDPIIL